MSTPFFALRAAGKIKKTGCVIRCSTGAPIRAETGAKQSCGRLRRPRRLGRPPARLPPRLAAAAPALPPGVRSAAPRHRLGARSGGLSSRGACRRFVKTGCTCPAPLPSSSLLAPHRLPWHSLARSPQRGRATYRAISRGCCAPLTKSWFCPIGTAN